MGGKSDDTPPPMQNQPAPSDALKQTWADQTAYKSADPWKKPVEEPAPAPIARQPDVERPIAPPTGFGDYNALGDALVNGLQPGVGAVVKDTVVADPAAAAAKKTPIIGQA
jgi:hypothetical protein